MVGIDEAIANSWCIYGAYKCTPAAVVGQWSVLIFIAVFWITTNFRPCLRRMKNINEAATERFENEMGSQESLWVIIVHTCCNSGMPFVFFLAGPLHALPLAYIHGEIPAIFQIVGAVLSILCLVGFLTVHTEMGENFSTPWVSGPVIMEQHSFVVSGVFRFARHPMYVVFLWFSVAIALATFNWLLVIVWLPFTFQALARIPREERMMVDQFGEEYLEYRRRVSALGPLCSCFKCFEGDLQPALLSAGGSQPHRPSTESFLDNA